jgi:hypothetical protein
MLSGGEWIAVVAIGAWAAIVLYRIYLAGRTRDQAHRERLAMIEKGLVPPPETDPQRFDAMMDWRGRYGARGQHSRRTGIILLALGLAFSLTGYMQIGSIRMGGTAGVLLIFLGVAFLLISVFEARPSSDDGPRPRAGM